MQQSALLQAKAYYLVKPTEFGSSLLILKRDLVISVGLSSILDSELGRSAVV